MIPVTIESLIISGAPTPSVIVLRPFGDSEADGRVLPIWIGPAEAASIGIALEQSQHSRPLTHDLMKSLVDASNLTLKHVTIDKVEGTTFYATLSLNNGDKDIFIDARPSDSIALAVRSRSPIYVTDDVMDVASFPYLSGINQESEEEQIERFHKFVEDVEPGDFKANDSLPRD